MDRGGASAVNTENRRRFSRIEFDAESTLHAGDETLRVELLDISLRGALVALPENAPADFPDPLELRIRLSAGGQEIRMACRAAHREADQLGLHCEHIDLDSAAHLRRLVELNLGDPDLLDRELANLL